jgi:hypothetical protein
MAIASVRGGGGGGGLSTADRATLALVPALRTDIDTLTTDLAAKGVTTVQISTTQTTKLKSGVSVNLKLAGGSIHIPLADATGTWWFSCTDASVNWVAADEPLINGVAGPAVAAAIVNGSRVAAIGDNNQQFRLNGVLAAGPLIYRSAGLLTVQRAEGQTVYEVSPSGGAGGSAAVKIPTQSTPPDPAVHQFWFDTSGGGLIVKSSNGSSWFATAI